jgi:hypothetical protein
MEQDNSHSPIKLAPKPSLSAEVKAQVVLLAQQVLAQAEAGEIQSFVILAKQLDGSWDSRASAIVGMSDAIGQLEMLKHHWIDQFIKANSQGPGKT